MVILNDENRNLAVAAWLNRVDRMTAKELRGECIRLMDLLEKEHERFEREHRRSRDAALDRLESLCEVQQERDDWKAKWKSADDEVRQLLEENEELEDDKSSLKDELSSSHGRAAKLIRNLCDETGLEFGPILSCDGENVVRYIRGLKGHLETLRGLLTYNYTKVSDTAIRKAVKDGWLPERGFLHPLEEVNEDSVIDLSGRHPRAVEPGKWNAGGGSACWPPSDFFPRGGGGTS